MIQDLIPDTLPSYGGGYKVGGYNRLGEEYYALISERDGSGDPVDVKGLGGNPINISTGFSDKEIFDNVAGSSANISMLADSTSYLMKLARGDDFKYKVEVSEDGSTLFAGYLKPETYRQDYERMRPEVSVEATDGIGLLKNIRFLSEIDDWTELKGKHSVTDIISYILYKAGNRGDWYDCINYTTEPGSNLLKHLEIPLWDYYGESCYDVLISVLSIFDAQIIQIDGSYHIRLADHPEGEAADIYTYRGETSGSSIIDKTPVDIHDVFKGAQGDVRIERPVKELIIEAPQVAIEEFVFNGEFASGEGWSEWGSVDSWDIDEVLKLPRTEVDPMHPPGQWVGGVKTNISRGTTTATTTRIKLEIEARAYGMPNATFWFGIDDSEMFQRTVFEDWETQTYVFEISSGVSEIEIYIASPIRTQPMPGGIYIRKVSAYPANFAKDAVSDKENTQEVEVNSYGQQEVTHEIKRPFGGDVYRYANVFPGITGKQIPGIEDRITGVNYTNKQIQTARAVNFYSTPRMRVGMGLYVKDDLLRIDSILYDKHYRREYVMTSLSYDLSASQYNVEALEHRTVYIIEEAHEWILAEGQWNDEGFWIDSSNWIDSL